MNSDALYRSLFCLTLWLFLPSCAHITYLGAKSTLRIWCTVQYLSGYRTRELIIWSQFLWVSYEVLTEILYRVRYRDNKRTYLRSIFPSVFRSAVQYKKVPARTPGTSVPVLSSVAVYDLSDKYTAFINLYRNWYHTSATGIGSTENKEIP